MALDLLDTPLRLTWDIPDEGWGVSGAELLSLAERVVEAGVFYVTLEGAPLSHAVVDELLSLLKEGGCQLLVGCRGAETELDALSRSSDSIDRLLLDLSAFLSDERGLDKDLLDKVIERIRSQGVEPSLSLTPLRHNLALIPVILAYCAARNVPRFKLPNADIGDSFRRYSPDDLPRWQDLEVFRQLWAVAELSDPLPSLEIHDLFLWEIMTPGDEQARSEYGGCQAANSLGHVDREGKVHPCAAWPEVLGFLLEQDLDDIWQSPGRLAVREQVVRQPQGCVDCGDWGLCRGGCRGLAEKLGDKSCGRDLMCRGPR